MTYIRISSGLGLLGLFFSKSSFFLLPSWRALRFYRPYLDKRDPIWGDNWSHSPFIKRSPSWGFLRFSSAVRQMPGDLCTAPRIISLSSLSRATDVTDATLGARGIWLGTRTGAGSTATLVQNFFGRSPRGSIDNRVAISLSRIRLKNSKHSCLLDFFQRIW